MSEPDPTYFTGPDAFRAWLEEHHATASELWVGFHRKATGRPSMTWPESVDEALCYGWIDGIRKRIDDERYTIRFTPRQATSNWSKVNLERMAALERDGRVQPAGRRAFAERREAKTGVYSYEQRQKAALDAEQEARFRADADAWAYWTAQPPGYRKTATCWVVSAKRAETRARRLTTLIADCAAGQRIGPLRRP